MTDMNIDDKIKAFLLDLTKDYKGERQTVEKLRASYESEKNSPDYNDGYIALICLEAGELLEELEVTKEGAE